MDEQWRPVLGYEGLYEVSDLGNVRSLDRRVRRGSGYYLKSGQLLSPGTVKSGHQLVVLCNSSGKRSMLVHRLVLDAFIGPRPDGQEACHNNGDPGDNRLANLRWDTRSSNLLDMVSHGVHKGASKTHCAQGHEFTPENTWQYARQRRCKTCSRNYKRKKSA